MLDSVVKTRVRQFDQDAERDNIMDVLDVWWRFVKTLPGESDSLGSKEDAQEKMKVFLESRCDIFIALKSGKIIGYAAVEDTIIRSFVVLSDYHGIERHVLDHATLVKGELSVQLYTSDTTTQEKFKRFGYVEDESQSKLEDKITNMPIIYMKLALL